MKTMAESCDFCGLHLSKTIIIKLGISGSYSICKKKSIISLLVIVQSVRSFRLLLTDIVLN
jgi:hypothetical protein